MDLLTYINSKKISMNKKEEQIEKFIKKYNNFDEIIMNFSSGKYFNLIDRVEKILESNFKFKNIPINEIYLGGYFFDDYTLGNYYTTLIIIKPFITHREPFDIDYFFFDIFNEPDLINNYFDNLIQYFNIERKVKVEDDIQFIIDKISIFCSKNFLIKSGISISLYDFIQLYKKNKDIEDAVNFSIEEGSIIDPQELAKKQDAVAKKMIDAIVNDPEDNAFKTYINAGAGINKNQFAETFSYIGFKPDYYGKVIPKPINTSFVKGLDVVGYFINATGGRKALTMAKGQVKSSGYLNRKLGLLLSDCKIKNYNEDYDCGSKVTVPITIDSQQTLKRFNNRYYVDKKGKLKLIKEDNKDLIGKTLNLRSPITCACTDSEVCPICYGKMSRILQNKNIGTVATLVLTNPLTQRLVI